MFQSSIEAVELAKFCPKQRLLTCAKWKHEREGGGMQWTHARFTSEISNGGLPAVHELHSNADDPMMYQIEFH